MVLSKSYLTIFKPLLAACVVATLAQVHGSQVIPLSIDRLAARARVIVHGTVTSKTCLKSEKGEIYTRIELDVLEVWKGPATNHFVIVQAGGILGEERVEVIGQANYRAGEEVVDCLAVNSRGEGVSLGAGQGKFSVWTDEKTGLKRAASMYIGRGSPGVRNPAGAAPEIITVDDLRTRMTGGQK
jgi:hypothetical protein